jgi:hypothetical protein
MAGARLGEQLWATSLTVGLGSENSCDERRNTEGIYLCFYNVTNGIWANKNAHQFYRTELGFSKKKKNQRRANMMVKHGSQ